MKKNISSKTNLFFLELIIVIFLFALTSTLLLSVFIKANIMRESSKNKTYGMIAIQSVAEKIKGDMRLDTSQFPLYYNGDWQQVNSEEGSFVMEIAHEEIETLSGVMLDVQLEVSKLGRSKEEAIWQLAFKKYIPKYEGE